MSAENRPFEPLLVQCVSGVFSGCFSTSILHPLDLVKVRLQVHDGLRGRDLLESRKFINPLSYMSRIVRAQGFGGLYKGLAANVCASSFTWGIYFVLYFLALIYRYSHMKSQFPVSESVPVFFLCSVSSGLACVSLSNPLWVMKTRAMLSTSRRGFFDLAASIFIQEGLGGFYRGYLPGLFGTLHGGIQFMFYEYLKLSSPLDSMLGWSRLVQATLVYSTMSKLVASVSTYPFQVMRSRLQDARGDTAGKQYANMGDVMMRIMRYEGMRGFYRGLLANLLRVLPGNFFFFLAYENCVRVLEGARE